MPDIAALRLRLEVAQQLNETSWLILQAAGEGIYGLDAEGITTFANPAAEAMTGWKAEDLIGRSQHAMIHHSHEDGSKYPRETCPIYMAIRDGLVHRSDSEVFWRKDGTSFPVAYTSTPILRGGKPAGAVVLFQDISERKRREAWEATNHSVFLAMTSHLKLEATLAMITSAYAGHYPARSIALFLRRGTSLRLMAKAGSLDHLPHSFGCDASGERASACVLAAEQEREILVERRAGDEVQPRYKELEATLFSACLALPLRSGSGQVIGTVALFARADDSLNEHGRECLERVCNLARLATEHDQLYTELVRQSQHDHLTGLPNRLLLEDRLEQAILRAERNGTQVGVCYLDLDRFKQINDTLGHSAGDSFLQQVAAILTSNLREIDTVARQGGDEFIIVLPDLGTEAEAEEVCERILSCLRKRITLGKHTLTPSASIGISMYPAAGDSGTMLLRNADAAMYTAKRTGKDRVQRYDHMLGERDRKEVELQSALRFALERDHFILMYQPLYSMGKQLTGFEALLRWNHPELGLVSPTQFIPLAEESGIIVPIGEWVLNEACRQAKEWNDASPTPVMMFVNISGVQLGRADFNETIAYALRKSGLAPHLLELEITESWIIADPVAAAVRLRTLRELGVGISIDDFGTGHSSLSCLQQLPVDTIKIDQSFIACLDGTAIGSAIVRTIVALAEELGLKTVAEGVETEQQYDDLKSTACSLIQGYLFAKPLAAEEAGFLLQEKHAFSG